MVSDFHITNIDMVNSFDPFMSIAIQANRAVSLIYSDEEKREPFYA